jgi:ferredoxin-NADP reductase
MSELSLRVTGVAAEARDVLRLELADPAGAELPPFEPGAHLALHLPNGLVRHYSLVNDWRERHRYVLAVGRARNGRGGSDYVHSMLRQGMALQCGVPANNFVLDPSAERYLFIAGGIGITPIMSMIGWCEAQGKPWRLAYAARNRQRAAFYEELKGFGARAHFHFADERGSPLDIVQLIKALDPQEQIYCCGPAPLMAAVQQAGAHLPAGSAHFEWFSAPAKAAPPAGQAGFWIDLKLSGTSLHVPADQSILDVLEQHGHALPFSCREGLCGTCETTVCEGEPEHRDYVYSGAQRHGLRSMMICVSRARSERLVLDL